MKLWKFAVILGLALTAVFAGGAGDGEPEKAAAPAKEASKTEPPVPGGGEGVVQAPGASLRPASGEAGECIADSAAVDELKRRREQLESRGKELDARDAELKARERALEEEIGKITAVREEVAKVDDARKKENDDRVAKLVETLETMSPKAASILVASLDEALAVASMAKISTPKLAKIMNLMEPRKSARLSELLTGAVGKVKGGAASAAAQKAPAQAVAKASRFVSSEKAEEDKGRAPASQGLLASSLDIPLSQPKAAAPDKDGEPKEEGGEKDDDGKSK